MMYKSRFGSFWKKKSFQTIVLHNIENAPTDAKPKLYDSIISECHCHSLLICILFLSGGIVKSRLYCRRFRDPYWPLLQGEWSP
jgi:hypothetical protein